MPFTNINKSGADYLNSLNTGQPDSPDLGTIGMQQLLDSHPNINTEAINRLIDELTSQTAANNIGASVGSVAVKTVQAILTAFEAAIADRYTKLEANSLANQETSDLVKTFNIDLITGAITVTKKDGTSQTWDTALEKVPATFELVERGNSVYLKITNADGTFTETNVTELMNIYEFSPSTDISFVVSGSGNVKTVTANIRNSSITLEKLSPEVISQIQSYVNSASQSATAAQSSATAASQSAAAAQSSATSASQSATNANDSKIVSTNMAQSAQTSSQVSSSEANRSKAEADRAQSVANSVSNPVSYTPQPDKTEADKAQARANIGALGINDLNYGIWGVIIDETNSNPLTCITYTNDAVGMTKGSSAWDNMPIFKDIVPVLKPNDPNSTLAEDIILDKNNLAQKADGTPIDITSGNLGDVFSRFNKGGYLIYREGTNLIVKITDNPNAKSLDLRWGYHACSWDSEGDCSHFYVGTYLAYEMSGKMRSLSGKTPTVNQIIGVNISKCAANGEGYVLMPFYVLTYLQCLYLIKYGNLNSQAALGRGYVDGNGAAATTGGANAKGMYFGETTGKLQMKFAGIEDFWGNLFYWVGGLYSDASRNILTAYKNFNDTGAGYVNQGQGANVDIVGHMNQSQGTTGSGFIAKAVSGSATTYYADFASLNASRLPSFGGARADTDYAGGFYLQMLRSTTSANVSVGARLCYLRKVV